MWDWRQNADPGPADTRADVRRQLNEPQNLNWDLFRPTVGTFDVYFPALDLTVFSSWCNQIVRTYVCVCVSPWPRLLKKRELVAILLTVAARDDHLSLGKLTRLMISAPLYFHSASVYEAGLKIRVF